jgi:hypothetical protein
LKIFFRPNLAYTITRSAVLLCSLLRAFLALFCPTWDQC